MSAFKRILVAVDGSKNSKSASSAAVSMAKATGASLFVLSVIQKPVLTEEPASKASAGAVLNVINAAKASLEEFVREVEGSARAEKVKVRGEIIENVPSVVEAIVGYAEEWEVDLIVMGTRGLSGFRKLLLGSVSSGVVSHAPCSVLIVR